MGEAYVLNMLGPGEARAKISDELLDGLNRVIDMVKLGAILDFKQFVRHDDGVSRVGPAVQRQTKLFCNLWAAGEIHAVSPEVVIAKAGTAEARR